MVAQHRNDRGSIFGLPKILILNSIVIRLKMPN